MKNDRNPQIQRVDQEFFDLALEVIRTEKKKEIVEAWLDAQKHIREGEDDKARARLRYAQTISGDFYREQAAILWLTGTPIRRGKAAPPPRPYRVPPLWVGPHGCDVCGHNTIEGDFDPTEPCPECGTVYGTDFRLILKKLLARPDAPSKAAVARAVVEAKRWDVQPDSAETTLSGYLADKRPLPATAIAALLDAAGWR